MPVEFVKRREAKRLYPMLDIVDNGITLSVEGDDGNSYAVVSIGSNGKLYRHFGLPKELGLALEETGRISEGRLTVMPGEPYWTEFSTTEGQSDE